MKKITKLTGVICAVAMTAIMGFCALGEQEGTAGIQGGIFDGTVISAGEDSFMMTHPLEGGSEEIIVQITENTKILDGVNGYPLETGSLTAGKEVRVYAGPEMTLSLPAIMNGVVVLVKEEGEELPSYTTVRDLKSDSGVSAGQGGPATLTTEDGKSYTLDSSTLLLPYLTRNIVTEQDLTPGTRILLWEGQSAGTVSKIVIFAGDNGYDNTGHSSAGDGWQKREDGWYYLEQGQEKKGWLLENGEWYYLSPDTGLMQTGFLTLDGKTYFLKEDGKMLKEAHIFTPDESGALHINFQ